MSRQRNASRTAVSMDIHQAAGDTYAYTLGGLGASVYPMFNVDKPWRHQNGRNANFAFCDGHVGTLSQAETARGRAPTHSWNCQDAGILWGADEDYEN